MLSIHKPTLDNFTAHFCERLAIDAHAPDADEQLHAALEALIASHQTLDEEDYLQNKDIQRLKDYLEQMIHDIQSIQRSRAWRLGYRIMSLAKRVLGRQTSGDGFAHIDAVIERYHHWKKARD